MPWIETELRHDRLLDDMWDVVLKPHTDDEGNPWWQEFNESVERVEMFKFIFSGKSLVSVDGEWRRPTYIPPDEEGTFCLTRHLIMRRWDGEYLGLAQTTGAIEYKLEDLPEDEDVTQWLKDKYEEHVHMTSFYVYTMDEYTGYTQSEDEEDPAVVVISNDMGRGVFRMSMDVELLTEDEYFPNTYQSPIVKINLTKPEGTFTREFIGNVEYRTDTNWWRDSLIRVKGYVDPTSLVLTFQVDSAPYWDDNVVPIIPLFFGNLVTTDSKNDSVALFGGTYVPYDYDFDDSAVGEYDVIQPTTRNYVNYPSNGIDTIMVKRTKYGARYQKHYLQWNAPPNAMPPNRSDKRDGAERKYPRAWNKANHENYSYTFKPSKYSERTHVSRGYVVHPEDGVVGYLPNVVITPVVGMTEGEILELIRYCEECGEGD